MTIPTEYMTILGKPGNLPFTPLYFLDKNCSCCEKIWQKNWMRSNDIEHSTLLVASMDQMSCYRLNFCIKHHLFVFNDVPGLRGSRNRYTFPRWKVVNEISKLCMRGMKFSKHWSWLINYVFQRNFSCNYPARVWVISPSPRRGRCGTTMEEVNSKHYTHTYAYHASHYMCDKAF